MLEIRKAIIVSLSLCLLNAFIVFIPTTRRLLSTVELMEDVSEPYKTNDLPKSLSPSLPDDGDGSKKLPSVDIVSTGSLQRLDYLEAQKTTFGTHPAVRKFRTTTEHNDTDAQCHLTLTEADINEIVEYCHAPYPNRTETATLIRQKKFLPKKHPGWLCAQKRPIDGFAAVLSEYETDDMLPDYLMFIDDDSYVNVPETLRFLANVHPPNLPHAISGCRYISPIPLNFGFPIGGFGAILTRRTLQNMRRPIDCQAANPDKFTQFACWRLDTNDLLERHFFRNGMSVAELMIAYAKGMPFSQHKQWMDGNGFCFHSDLALAYFVNYYHVAVDEDVIERRPINDRMRMKHLGFINMNNSKKFDQCEFEGDNCKSESKFCHYVTPQQMRTLWEGKSQ